MILTHLVLFAFFSGAGGDAAPVGPVDAGKRRKKILIDVRGQIREFETQEGADAFLRSELAVEPSKIEAKARRIARAVVRTGNAFLAPELKPIVVMHGPPELQAFVNMRQALNETALRDAVRQQLEDDEDHAIALLMMA